MAAEQGGRETGPAAAAWLVWSVLGSTLLLLLAGVGLMLGVEPGTPYDSWLILLVNAPVFATIGAVLAARRPDHPIG
jgi:ABC-type transport system involved in cytochrome c biogenesis permease component